MPSYTLFITGVLVFIFERALFVIFLSIKRLVTFKVFEENYLKVTSLKINSLKTNYLQKICPVKMN